MDEYDVPQAPCPGEQAPGESGGRPARLERGRRVRPVLRQWTAGLLVTALGSHLLPALTLTVGQIEIVVRFR